MVKTWNEAFDALKRDPARSVTAEIDGLLIEFHCKGRRTAADLFRNVGPWEGESAEELTAFLHQARREGGSKEPPSF